jgi:serine/threonine protein kinase
VAHRDLKPENLLLGAEGVIKLCDFGVSRYVTGVKFNDAVGTPQYMAPELHQNLAYTGYAADVWSLGVMLYFLLTGQLPFNSKTDLKT